MTFFGNDLIYNYSLTSEDIETGSSIENIKTPQLGVKTQFDGNNVEFVLDKGSSIPTVNFMIGGTNFTTGTIKLYGSPDNTTWTLIDDFELFTDTWVLTDHTGSEQYYKIVIVTSEVLLVEIGYFYVGVDSLRLPGISQKAELYYTTTSNNTISVQGQIFGDVGYNYMSTKFSFAQISEDANTIMGISVATRKEIIEFFREHMNVTPFYVYLWEKNLDEYQPVLCIFNMSKINFKKLAYGKNYSTSISLLEVK